MTPARLALLSLLAAGCQCFVPVDEDGGVTLDAGRDAGVVACGRAADCPQSAPACDDPTGVVCACGQNKRCTQGRCETFEHFCPGPSDAGGECTSPTDCAGDAGPAVRFCGTLGGEWTCAFSRCVVECSGGRTCDSLDAGCLTCDGQTTCAQPGLCPFMTHLHVEASTCPQFPEGAFLRATSLSSQVCTHAIEDGDGGIAGTVTFFNYDELMADLPLAGGRCVGRQLPTGAIRFSLSCPDCMLSVRPEVVGP